MDKMQRPLAHCLDEPSIVVLTCPEAGEQTEKPERRRWLLQNDRSVSPSQAVIPRSRDRRFESYRWSQILNCSQRAVSPAGRTGLERNASRFASKARGECTIRTNSAATPPLLANGRNSARSFSPTWRKTCNSNT